MRWWLAVVFATVSALTAAAVVASVDARSESAFHSFAENLAIGNAVGAAQILKADRTPAALRRQTSLLIAREHVALFVFDRRARLLTPGSVLGLALRLVPDREKALFTALSGNRFIAGRDAGSAFVVGVRIHGGAGAALIAYARRPALTAEFGIVRGELPDAALLGLAVGAAAGLVIATLVARRLGRLAHAAEAMSRGEFTSGVVDRFPDEVGSLAASIEQTRQQIGRLVENLRSERDRLERLFDRLNDGVLLIDRSGHVEFANHRAETLLASGQTLAGRAIAEVDPFGRLQALAATLRAYPATSEEARLRLEDGRLLRATGVAPGPSDGSVIVVVADETERERNDRAQREFVANASHELRTPLAAIVSAVEMLQTGAKHDTSERDEFIGMIEQHAGRLTTLTRALLTLARAEAREEVPRVSKVGVRDILEHVVGSIDPLDGVEITLNCPTTLTVTANEDLLEQAVSSVAMNASQHTQAGTIAFSGYRLASNGHVVIDISDTGHGIDARDYTPLFDRFYRIEGEGEGFGLGLAIARQAVHALGGEITLTSTPGTGTNVRIVLPGAV